MDKNRRFWNRLAERYAKQPIADEAAYQRKLELTREHFTSDSEVLEFGCGTGSTAILHAPHVKHILAADVSEDMLDIARDKTDAAGITNITYERASLDELNLETGRFDIVLGLSILHLLDHRDDGIRRAYDWLKPGGVFITSTVCLGDKMGYMSLIAPIARFFGFFPLLRIFKSGALIESHRAAGFEIEYEWKPGKSPTLFLIARKPPTSRT